MEVIQKDFRRQRSDLVPWACQRRPPGGDIGSRPRSVSALGGQYRGTYQEMNVFLLEVKCAQIGVHL